MSAQPKTTVSPEEYLAAERLADHKSEFINGQAYAMSGASREHNRITLNLGAGLHAALKGRPCEPFVADMRVKVDTTGLYTYPDVIVVCGTPTFEDAEVDTLLNPTVLIEVLSPTTAAYDRAEKFAHYRRIPSLREYVLVSQDRPQVERFLRSGEDWILREFSGRAERFELPSIGVSLSLQDVYERVDFEEVAPSPASRRAPPP